MSILPEEEMDRGNVRHASMTSRASSWLKSLQAAAPRRCGRRWPAERSVTAETEHSWFAYASLRCASRVRRTGSPTGSRCTVAPPEDERNGIWTTRHDHMLATACGIPRSSGPGLNAPSIEAARCGADSGAHW